MGSERHNANSNIISMHDRVDKLKGLDDQDCAMEDVSEFIADMLDTLMKIATQKDQSLLVYFLAMARIEAIEMKNTPDEKK